MPETSTVSETLEGAWAAIRNDLGEGAGLYSRRVLKDSGFSIFVSISEPDGLPALFFEVALSSLKGLRLAQSARGFEVEVEKAVNAAGVSISRVAINPTRRPFADLFRVMAADVVERVLKTGSEPEAMQVLHNRVEHWRRFAEKVGTGGLAVHEQTGLFGELVFLKILLDSGVSPVAAVSAWHGPLRKNQDFGFGATAVEVKASTSNTPKVVTISNEWQLDRTGLSALFLFHLSLDRRKGSGTLLPDLVGRIAARLQEAGSELEELFDDRLFAQGYLQSQAGLYEEYGYTERERTLYEVGDAFPGIVESDLREGVSGVRYSLDLAAAVSFKVPEERVFSIIGS